MPIYEYRCRQCDRGFEVRRPMADADTGVTCPGGHADVRRLLSVFATAGATSGRPVAVPGGGGGCCGGSCGCR